MKLCHDDEEQDEGDPTKPRITPFVAGGANDEVIVSRRKREPKMPKGIYERKPKGDAANDAAPAPQKRGRKARGAVVPKVSPANGVGSKGRFDVSLDLRGGAVTINAAAGSLTLAADEVLALFAFMGRR